ncbi:hypothetical protein F7725_007775 [Dissostichus mawsoni]|uniref:Uncharacterized protein n=1 Tax=Dissostichus mawsoni TaxID=36200 RepID=A0A7J5Y5C5_DISMA|nr:hypothetical protein F7725_007775 [Dissostichus mawsoni]
MGIKEMLNWARVPSILLLGLVYVPYVLIGGVIFWKLEGDLGEKDIDLLLLNKKKLLTRYTCLNQEGLERVAEAFHKEGQELTLGTTSVHSILSLSLIISELN